MAVSSKGRPHAAEGHAAVSAVLFLSLFASQSGLIALSPVLEDVGRDLDVSTAAAGQLRMITGLVAGVTALALGGIASRIDLRSQLLLGTTLLGLGSFAGALAPTFVVLALAQIPLGAAVAVLTTASTLAAAEWVAPELRARVLSWTLIGGPAAWIVGMPLVGLVSERSWRLAWLALPLAAALLAGGAVARRPSTRAEVFPVRFRDVLAHAAATRWLASELLANTAWAGMLVFAGALFTETYDTSARITGVLLAIGAASAIAGNRVARRLPEERLGLALIALGWALAAALALFGSVRPSPTTSAVLFAAVAFVAGARTIVSSTLGLGMSETLRHALMAGRAATLHFGYFAGAMVGGVALAIGGYTALGVLLGGVAAAASVTLALPAPTTVPGTRRGRWAVALPEACM